MPEAKSKKITAFSHDLEFCINRVRAEGFSILTPEAAALYKSMMRKLRRSTKKNPCPKTANPRSSAVRDAIKLSEQFHGARPRKIRELDFNEPQSLTLIGRCAQVDYMSDKYDGKKRRYFHEFTSPCLLLADPKPQKDGSRVLVLYGKFKITERGIIG